MKNVLIINLVLLMVIATNGCKKDPETTDIPDNETPVADNQIKLPLELPPPVTEGTPENLDGVINLKPPLGHARPALLVPKGVKNVALNKPVTSSELDPIMGELQMIVDGDKNASDVCIVELGLFEQWVQIDLEKEYDIYAIALWHYHKAHRVYYDVVIQISNDIDFITDVKTVFNNDMDNSHKLGVGNDLNYVETAEGLLVEVKNIKGRYVRFYSNKNHTNDYNHYIEAEVYAK